MSHENVELVRRAMELFNGCVGTGETPSALLELCHPDIRVDGSQRIFNPEVYEGREGLQRLIREVWEAWEDFSARTERLVDAGERVVAIQVISGRGRASRTQVEGHGALVWTVRDKLVSRIELFADHREALAAVGADGR